VVGGDSGIDEARRLEEFVEALEEGKASADGAVKAKMDCQRPC
jgi:hypothetical protein